MVAGLFSLFVNLMLLGPTLYMLQVYDRVLTARSVPTLMMLTIGVGIALFSMSLVDFARGRLLALGARQIDDMLGRRILRQVITNASALGRNGYIHGLKDVATLRTFLAGNNVVALFDTPWLLFFIVVIFLFHPWMGGLAVVGALLLLILAWLNETTNRRELERYQEAARRGGQLIDQGLRNADVLNSMGMAERFAENWARQNTAALDQMQQTGIRMGGVLAVSKFLRQFIQIAMMGLGAYLVIHDNLSPGIMIAGTILLGRAMAPVESLIGNWNGLVAARSAYARLAQLFPQVFDETPRHPLPPPQGSVQVENVFLAGASKDHPILQQIRFDLPAGHALAILGPSGSGKSSLAKLIAGVWAPTAGHVRIDGSDVRHWADAQLGQYLGYLPQDVELFSGTIAENIGRFDTQDREAITAAAKAAHAYDLIVRLPDGFETRLGEGGIQLSAGQAQRIGLARALYGCVRLVILDEPNANLDAEGEQALMRTLQELKANQVTVILITHKPSLVSTMDALLIMRDGRVELVGPRDEVLARLNGQKPSAVTPMAPVRGGA